MDSTKPSLGPTRDLPPDVAVKGDDLSKQPYLAVSDGYMDFVRYGYIKVHHGKLEDLSGRTVRTSSGAEIDDVAAIVLATGFDASFSLSFLPESVQKTLSLSPGDLNNTVSSGFPCHTPSGSPKPWVCWLLPLSLLGSHGDASSLHRCALVGRRRIFALSPFRYGRSTEKRCQHGKNYFSPDRPAGIAIPNGRLSLAYAGICRSIGTQALEPSGPDAPPPPDEKEMNILTPARYPDGNLSEEQQNEVKRLLRQTEETVWSGIRDGKFTARAVFRSLLGEWKLERELVSRRSSHPSGHFSGTAKFLLRQGTKDGRDAEFAQLEKEGDLGLEYLYIEEGDFAASNGMKFRAARRYVWRYDEKKDRISVWFAQSEDQKKADYLFHDVEFQLPGDDKNRDGWEATAGHLCIKDFYNVHYNFHFAAVNLVDWRLLIHRRRPAERLHD